MMKTLKYSGLLAGVLFSGLVQAHGTHSISNPSPLSGSEHLLVHLGEWAVMIFAGFLALRWAIRIFKA